MSAQVGFLEVLLLGVGVLLLLLLGIRSRLPLSGRRRALVLATRAFTLLFAFLALVDLRLRWPTDEVAIAAVIDGGATISAQERNATMLAIDAMVSRHGDLVTELPAAAGLVTGDRELAIGLRAARGSLEQDVPGHLVVATDGHDSAGELARAVADVRRSGVRVSFVPIGDEPPVDLVAVSGLDLPRLVRAGDDIEVGLDLVASRATQVSLSVAVEGGDHAEQVVAIAAGAATHRLSVEAPSEEGTYLVTARAMAAGDTIAANNEWRALFRVVPRPRVQLIHDLPMGEPVLAQVLRDEELEVEVLRASGMADTVSSLDPYALVVLDEIDPEDLSEEQQSSLRTWVEELGGGLLTITGDHAVRHGPPTIREIEPVRPPPAIPEPRPLELVLVIDRSSSMEGMPIAQARRAGVAAVRALRQDARVGVVAFSGTADRVIAPLPMDQAGEASGFISRITASGGTNIAAALAAAGRVMSDDPRYIHHVILLSDGESAAPPAFAQAQMLASRGISISAITLGSYSQLMARIAEIGRGRYHVTRSAGSLPALFVREAQYRQPPAHRRIQFQPARVSESPLTSGIDFEGGPPLEGHALAELRPGAETLLAVPGGEPLLAHWHVGLGQAATFTSATSGGWADGFRRAPAFRSLFSQLAWGILRNRTHDTLTMDLSPDPRRADQRLLTVFTPTLDDARAPVATLHRGATQPSPLQLRNIGPGVFQATVSVADAGASNPYGLLVTAHMPHESDPTAAAGEERPYPAELAGFGVDRASLERLATIGGGEVLTTTSSAGAMVIDAGSLLASHQGEVGLRPLRTWLWTLALASYLFGLLLLRLPDRGLTARVVGGKSSGSGQPTGPKASKGPVARGAATTQQKKSSKGNAKEAA